jgi:hypothetical protein
VSLLDVDLVQDVNKVEQDLDPKSAIQEDLILREVCSSDINSCDTERKRVSQSLDVGAEFDLVGKTEETQHEEVHLAY